MLFVFVIGGMFGMAIGVLLMALCQVAKECNKERDEWED